MTGHKRVYPDYVKLLIEHSTSSAKSGNADDRKPQYISFKNPLLVDLFEKSVRRVDKELTIVEMLPTSEQLFKIGNNHYVTEFVVEWYTDD